MARLKWKGVYWVLWGDEWVLAQLMSFKEGGTRASEWFELLEGRTFYNRETTVIGPEVKPPTKVETKRMTRGVYAL